MQLGGKEDFLSRFMGWMHIPSDPPRFQVDYDRFLSRRPGTSSDDAHPHHAAPSSESDDFAGARSPRPLEVPADAWDPAQPVVDHFNTPPAAVLPASGAPRLPSSPPAEPHGGGGGGGGVLTRELHIDVVYGTGGDQMDLRVTQANLLRSDDAVTDAEVAPPRPADGNAELHRLEEIAAHQVPEAYAGTDMRSPDAIVATLVGLGAHEADQSAGAQGAGGIEILREGMFVDGVKVPAGDPLPADPADAVPARPGDHDANMAVVVTGDNLAANFAGLANENGATGTLLVLGDSFKSDAIVQTNVLVDRSQIDGAAAGATIQADGNAAGNVAELVSTLQHNPYSMGFFGGLHWQVDRLDGNFYDIRLVTQYNRLADSDAVQQTATDHFKFIGTGENEQGNELVAYNIDPSHYDLVVVAGNYYAANWIFQTNILLDNNSVTLASGPGGAGDQTVSTGADWLLNTATIVDYSGPAHPMTAGLLAVAGALQNGQQSLDPALGLDVPGNGSSQLNVLFISGSYYDLNVLRQTNVVSDSDAVRLTLAQGESGYVAAGGNVLRNDAVLIDVGPTGGQFVAGGQYSESVLVQTSIIAQSTEVAPGGPGLLLNDPGKLVSEAAPIIAAAAAPADTAAPPVAAEGTAHVTVDPLGGLMS